MLAVNAFAFETSKPSNNGTAQPGLIYHERNFVSEKIWEFQKSDETLSTFT